MARSKIRQIMESHSRIKLCWLSGVGTLNPNIDTLALVAICISFGVMVGLTLVEIILVCKSNQSILVMIEDNL